MCCPSLQLFSRVHVDLQTVQKAKRWLSRNLHSRDMEQMVFNYKKVVKGLGWMIIKGFRSSFRVRVLG